MAYKREDVLAGATAIRAHLDELVGDRASEVRSQLDELITRASTDPKAATRILALLRKYPLAYQWIRQHLELAYSERSESIDGEKGGWVPFTGEIYVEPEPPFRISINRPPVWSRCA